MDLLPKTEAAARVERLQSWMQSTGIDAVFVLQNADLYYLSGTVQVGVLCLPAAGAPLLLVQKSAARARIESPWERVIPLGGLSKIPDILAAEGVAGLKRVGLEMDVLPASYYLRFQNLFAGTEFVDVSESIRTLRMIKSHLEVDQIRAAAQMLDRVFSEVTGWISPGITELELAARVEGFLRLQGHPGITRMRGFNLEIAYGTVSSGTSASFPTYFPGPVGCVGLYPAIPSGASRRTIASGDPLMVDIVGGFGGYIADKTRTFALGELPRDMRDGHDFTLMLLREIESMLRPGVPCKRIYRHTCDLLKDSPYRSSFMGAGENQVRFVGHGVGLELDDLPVLAAGFDVPLQEGMTIAIEPKIFFPERGGVGVENTYLITAAGFENLTPFPEELISI